MVEEDRVFDTIHGHGMYFAEKIDKKDVSFTWKHMIGYLL